MLRRMDFLPFREEETEGAGLGKERGTGKEQNEERKCSLNVDWGVSGAPGKPGSHSSWATDRLCDLAAPRLTSPGLYFVHHLHHGNNSTDLTGLMWGGVKRCACSAWHRPCPAQTRPGSWARAPREGPLPAPPPQRTPLLWLGGHTCPNFSSAEGNVF